MCCCPQISHPIPRERFSPLHSLRHSLATHMLEDDVPFSVISDILGHASMSTTMIYAKASVESLRHVALSIREVCHDSEA